MADLATCWRAGTAKGPRVQGSRCLDRNTYSLRTHDAKLSTAWAEGLGPLGVHRPGSRKPTRRHTLERLPLFKSKPSST